LSLGRYGSGWAGATAAVTGWGGEQAGHDGGHAGGEDQVAGRHHLVQRRHRQGVVEEPEVVPRSLRMVARPVPDAGQMGPPGDAGMHHGGRLDGHAMVGGDHGQVGGQADQHDPHAGEQEVAGRERQQAEVPDDQGGGAERPEGPVAGQHLGDQPGDGEDGPTDGPGGQVAQLAAGKEPDDGPDRKGQHRE
jgi:hypothetical protein